MIRVFAAHAIPENIAAGILAVTQRNAGLAGVRWTKEDNLHVTLFFIGETEKQNTANIISGLQRTLPAFRKFALEFDCIEVRMTKRKPSMIWAKFKKSAEFSRLSSGIYGEVKEFMTIAPSHKDPVPHCTLARIKPGADITDADLQIGAVPPIEITGIELWMTVNTSEGARYECLWKGAFAEG